MHINSSFIFMLNYGERLKHVMSKATGDMSLLFCIIRESAIDLFG